MPFESVVQSLVLEPDRGMPFSLAQSSNVGGSHPANHLVPSEISAGPCCTHISEPFLALEGCKAIGLMTVRLTGNQPDSPVGLMIGSAATNPFCRL